MPKKRNAERSPLADYWMPPQNLVANGVGEPVACLATTFEFKASLFEEELLPRFFGLKFDHTENEPSFRSELEEALQMTPVIVLVDASHFDPSQTTLSWDQIPVAVPGGIQHAKIVVLAWQRLVRVILGSANLTLPGYRRNRELFAALDFWNDVQSTPTSVLSDVLDLLKLIPTWSRAAPATVDRCQETVDRIRATASRWSQAPRDFPPRERPRVRLVATHPKATRQPARSSLGEVTKLWGDRRAGLITVVTPFVSPNAGADRDFVIDKLLDVPRSRDCDGWLVVPSLPTVEGIDSKCISMPASFAAAWQNAFSGTRSAWVLPIPLHVEGVDKTNRVLHSKAVHIEGDSDELLLIGSSNFTPRGMGLGVYNVEANLAFEDRAYEVRDGQKFADRLGLPVSWDEAMSVDEAQWQEPDKLPEDEPSNEPVVPDFFMWAAYSQKHGRLRIGLDRSRTEPHLWSIALPGSGDDRELILFRCGESSETTADELTMIFEEASRGISLVAVNVVWQHADDPQSHTAKLAVAVESKDDLLPTPEFRALSADAIIDCLISGKSPAEWCDQQRKRSKKSARKDAALDSLRTVETSGYLLYRVRRFGRALAGMAERIERTAIFSDAIRYRLFKDPLGPVSLAEMIVPREDDGIVGWLNNLETEHRVFLIAEILLTVGELRHRTKRRAVRREERAALRLFDEATQRLVALLDEVMSSADDGVFATNLTGYVADVKVRSLAVVQPADEESVDAR